MLSLGPSRIQRHFAFVSFEIDHGFDRGDHGVNHGDGVLGGQDENGISREKNDTPNIALFNFLIFSQFFS